MTTNPTELKTLMKVTSMQVSFPEAVPDSLGRNSLVLQTVLIGWFEMILEMEVLGWCGYTWSTIIWLVSCTAKCFGMTLQAA